MFQPLRFVIGAKNEKKSSKMPLIMVCMKKISFLQLYLLQLHPVPYPLRCKT